MKGLALHISRIIMIAVLIMASIGSSSSEAKVIVPQRTVTCSSSDMHYHYCRAETDNHVRLRKQISGAPCIQGRSWGYDRHGIWVDRGCRAEFEYGNDGSSGKTAAIVGGVAAAGILAAVLTSRAHHDDYKDMNSTERSYYDRGYQLGQRDHRNGYDKHYSRHKEEYDRDYESAFKKGYETGYDEYRNRNDYDYGRDRDENFYGAPNWAVGTFRGYNPLYSADVELRIYPDGDVKAKNISAGERIDGYYRNGRIFLGPNEFEVRQQGSGLWLIQVDNRSNNVVYRKVY